MQSENGTCRRTPRWIWALTLLIAIVVLPGAAMVRSQESNRPEPATRTTNGSTSVDIVSPNTPAIRNRTIYLGLSANAIKDLQKYGSVTSPIPNGSIDRIVISDRNIPKSGRVKLIQPSIQGDALCFVFNDEKLSEISNQSFEFTLPESIQRPFRKVKITYSPASANQQLGQQVQQKPKSTFSTQIDERFRASGRQFDPNAANAQFEARIMEMTRDEDEQRRVAEELKDKAWKSLCARKQLQNCKRAQVELKLRVANMPFDTETDLWEASEKLSERQIPQTQLKKLLEHIGKTENAQVSAVKTITAFVGSKVSQTESAKLHRTLVSGIQTFSILDPENLKPQTSDLHEGVTLNFAVNEDGKDSISLEGQLSFERFQVSSGGKLPLKLGSNEIKIETAQPLSFPSAFKWSIPKDQVQIVFSAADMESKSQMIVIVEASRKPALVGKDEDLTLEHVLSIKKNLPSELTPATAAGFDTPVIPIAPGDDPNIASKAEAQTAPSKPLELVIQCGETNKKRSLNTKIGLANNATLTIEGEVDSQQISADDVQVRGKNFVFKNEGEVRYVVDDAGESSVSPDTQAKNKAKSLFRAEAGSGSISFNREGPIEDTLRLSLQSNAELQFAGVEFSADSIECWPDRIEATGNVTMSIPEISSKVSAGRVIMNLKSLAFDFDGDVKVERNVDGDSFPFLVKGNHVGWSLITGEMQTDVRYSSSQSRQRVPISTANSTFGGGTQSTNRARSRFQNGFTVPSGNRIGQAPPKRSAAVRESFPQPKTRNRFGNPPK